MQRECIIIKNDKERERDLPAAKKETTAKQEKIKRDDNGSLRLGFHFH